MEGDNLSHWINTHRTVYYTFQHTLILLLNFSTCCPPVNLFPLGELVCHNSLMCNFPQHPCLSCFLIQSTPEHFNNGFSIYKLPPFTLKLQAQCGQNCNSGHDGVVKTSNGIDSLSSNNQSRLADCGSWLAASQPQPNYIFHYSSDCIWRIFCCCSSTARNWPRPFIVEVSRSHSDTRHSIELLWTSDRLVAETST